MRLPSRPNLVSRTPALAVAALAAIALVAAAPTSAGETLGAQTAAPVPPACVRPLDPTPGGAFGRTNEPFPTADHFFLQSSTHLQGVRTMDKWAGGLLYQPSAIPAFRGFTSAIVVDNPDPVATVAFHIDYFDHNGTLVGTSFPLPLPPEATHIEAATPLGASSGVGSAHVVVDAGPGILGAVLLHTTCIAGICDQDVPLSVNGHRPGASSMQQLQVAQDTPELWWGPLPFSLVGASDFYNGEAPFLWVVNPNPQPNRVRVDLIRYDRIAGTVLGSVWRTLTLPPFGTLLEKSGSHLAGTGLWDQFIAWYSAPPTVDADYLVHVVSLDGLPILGDGVMTDIFGNGTGGPLTPGLRFRMASTNLASDPTWRLIDPDLSYQPGGVIQTLIGVHNVGAADAGPLTIEYFDSFGTLVSSATVPSLPPNRSLRIQPGALGYPGGTVGFGWARITACTTDARLVGWTVREILDVGARQWHKAFGDTLVRIDGAEPGPGFTIADPGSLTPWIRKVMPLVRVTPSFPWPGYTSFVNDRVANINNYRWKFHALGGGLCGLTPFPGLPWAFTSWTYEDPLVTCSGNLSGRVDHRVGDIDGIDVLGDPFDEYGIPGFGIDIGPQPIEPIEPAP